MALRADNCIHVAPRWGFVVYRCSSYADDFAWNRFISMWKDMVFSFVSDIFDGGPRLAKNFEMVIKEDPSLEGANVETVRAIHQAWAASESFSYDCTDRDSRTDPLKPWLLYEYCVCVDADALASCLNYLSTREGQKRHFPFSNIGHGYTTKIPYVTVVRCYDIPCLNPGQDEDEMDEEEDEDEEDEDRVKTEPNSLNVSLDSVHPALYSDMNERLWSFMEYQLASDHLPDGIVIH